MGAAYQILGKTVQPHQLALGTVGAVLLLVIPKPWNGTAKPVPAINASSPEEEKFINEYLSKKQEQH